ncbi:hypothetical protein [Massilia sp. HP4]|uniref:hypothetical protein n=1 Tax=Massilia sp. HP4 TaxID=2562316 RepID=UPI001E2DE4B5|nr:hypothetical protein [Massilia sp. HP4]
MPRHFALICCLSFIAFHTVYAQELPKGGGLDSQRVTQSRYGAVAKPEATAEGDKRNTLEEPTRESPPPPSKKPSPGPVSARKSGETPPVAAGAEPSPIPGAIATLWLERTANPGPGGAQVPVTFGQAFAPGAVPRDARLGGRLADGKEVPLQVDVKALHADGTIRHAIISGIVPGPKDKPVGLGLVRQDRSGHAGAAPVPSTSMTPSALLKSGLTTSVTLNIDGSTYSASLERLLEKGKPMTWLDGPIVREWHVNTPVTDSDGRPHPHLAARFGVRWFPALKKARVDVTIENNWAFEPSPRNFTYDATITVGNDVVFRQASLTHYHHARWRKLAWWGGDPDLHVRHDTAQLLGSRAVPNYDRSVRVNERTLADLYARWNGPASAPMNVGLAVRGMPTTGGRQDIGLQPSWAVMYLLGMDARARTITLGTADQAGSWSMHYRDRRTGLPVSLIDYPYMTTFGKPSDTHNPATGKKEAFPVCAGAGMCKTPYHHDVPHQPNLTYIPYLLSGDLYYLEELQFWASYNVFSSNPGYRQHAKGLLKPIQVRGQAWALRTLAETAYITPDTHPLKRHFLQIVDSNLDWYNAEYTDNPRANALGFLANGYATVYRKGTGIAPWQDDFFTSAVGRTAELGFSKANRLLAWKAKFPVARMTGKGACWVTASMYSMRIRDERNSPFYTTIGEAFQKSYPPEIGSLECGSDAYIAAVKLRPGEMSGYAGQTTGYPSIMQAALAYSVTALGEPGRLAWKRFMERGVKPDYGKGPQFAIIPRDD